MKFIKPFLFLATAANLVLATVETSAAEPSVEAEIQVFMLEPTRLVTLDGPARRVQPVHLIIGEGEHRITMELTGGRAASPLRYSGPAEVAVYETGNGANTPSALGALHFPRASGRYLLLVMPPVAGFAEGERVALLEAEPETRENTLVVKNLSSRAVAVNLDETLIPLTPWESRAVELDPGTFGNKTVQLAVNQADSWRVAYSSTVTFSRSNHGILLIYPQEASGTRWQVRRLALWQ